MGASPVLPLITLLVDNQPVLLLLALPATAFCVPLQACLSSAMPHVNQHEIESAVTIIKGEGMGNP